MLPCLHASPASPTGAGGRSSQAPPCTHHGTPRSPAVWQDDVGPVIERGAFLRPRRPAEPRPAGRAANCPGGLEWHRRDRRSAAASRISFHCSASLRIANRPHDTLLLGSASPDLVKEVSESLAGRVAYHDLGPLAVDETGVSEWRKLWLRGGFPRSYLSDGDTASALWREDFIPQPPGTRHPRPRDLHSVGDPASILGDGEPLPRPDPQPFRAWSIVRRLRSHGSPLPRNPERYVHDPPAAPVARERRQATREGAQAVHPGQRTVSHPAHHRDIRAVGVPSEARRIMGGPSPWSRRSA